MKDQHWKWSEIRDEHGEEAANKAASEWLRTMADTIDAESYPRVMEAELEEVGPITILKVSTSFPWGG